jgi:integrase
LRHTAATIIYKYVARDILLLQKFLGHKSIATTEVYTHTFNGLAKSAVDHNPLNEFEKIA